MEGAELPFKVYWASTIHPAIKDDFERLLNTTPTRIAEKKDKAKKDKKDPEQKDNKKKDKEQKEQSETDPIDKKLSEIFAEVKEKGERRNAYMNLAWTGPIDNSFLQEKIPMGKVENMAADLFLRSLPRGEAAETVNSESQEAADDAEPQPQGKVERRPVEILNETARRPWQIPQMVERGFEIPIMVTAGFVKPDLGKFKRLGMDKATCMSVLHIVGMWSRERCLKKSKTDIQMETLEIVFRWSELRVKERDDDIWYFLKYGDL